MSSDIPLFGHSRVVIPHLKQPSDMTTMDLDHFIQEAREYRLHTCKHCQVFVIDITDVRGPDICTHRTPGKQAFNATADNCTFFKFCISTIKVPVPSKDNLTTQLFTKDIAETATLTVKVRHRRSEKVDTLYFMAGWEVDGSDDDLSMHDEFFSLSPSRSKLPSLIPVPV